MKVIPLNPTAKLKKLEFDHIYASSVLKYASNAYGWNVRRLK